MKRQRLFTVLLSAALAVAAIAPLASANSRDGDDYSCRHGNRRSRSSDYRDYRDDRGYNSSWGRDRDSRRGWQSYDGSWGQRGRYASDRDYYYLDTTCGQQSQYISDFKGRHDRYGRSPVIEKIDIRSGQCLASYRFDDRAGQWRSCGNQDYSNRNGYSNYSNYGGYSDYDGNSYYDGN